MSERVMDDRFVLGSWLTSMFAGLRRPPTPREIADAVLTLSCEDRTAFLVTLLMDGLDGAIPPPRTEYPA